jgi:hypothetical protein
MRRSHVTPPVRFLDRPCEAHHATPQCPRMKSAFDVRSAWRFENLSLAVPPQTPAPLTPAVVIPNCPSPPSVRQWLLASCPVLNKNLRRLEAAAPQSAGNVCGFNQSGLFM